MACHQLRPLLPLWALVPVVKRGLVGGPAALLVAVPERREAHTLLQIRHPVYGKVDHTGQRPCGGEGEESYPPQRHLHHSQTAPVSLPVSLGPPERRLQLQQQSKKQK